LFEAINDARIRAREEGTNKRRRLNDGGSSSSSNSNTIVRGITRRSVRDEFDGVSAVLRITAYEMYIYI